MKSGFLIFVALLGALVSSGYPTPQHEAQAISPYLDHIRAVYQKPLKCTLCHYKNGLNVYGQDFHKAWQVTPDLRKALKSIGSLDSDGDTFTNLQELKAGCAPYDANVFPDEENRQPCLTRPQHIPTKPPK